MKGRRRSNAKRYATGRIVQPAAAEMRATVIEARQRVYGLGKSQAAEPEAIDVLGRMYLVGEISQRQKQAGDRYAEIRRDYRKAILARRMPSGGNLERQRGHDDSDGTDQAYVAWCERSIAVYDHLRRALMDCGE